MLQVSGMLVGRTIVLSLFLLKAAALPEPPDACSVELRQKLKWGAATAAYQVEGAWQEDGRTPSIWDTYSHKPGMIANNDNGDIACDHYHKYPEDFKLMKDMGIKHYRFSFSWNRILPQGTAGSPVNQAGLDHYNRFINSMLENGITPYATIFHWDLPQVLEDKYGGLLGGQFVEDFTNYASVLFANFGDRVKDWMTFNEPWVTCVMQYGDGSFAPGKNNGWKGRYTCGHHLLLAHGSTVALYRRQYKRDQGGRLGIALNIEWGEPLTDSTADKAAAQINLDLNFGWFADVLYFGDYPALIKKNRPVPEFTWEQQQMLRGSLDFLGINFYTAKYVRAVDWTADRIERLEVDEAGKPIGPLAQSSWLRVVPWGLHKILKYADARYGHPDIFITENGVSAPGEAGLTQDQAVKDSFRLAYFHGYLTALCKAVSEGVHVTNYFAWSAMDNFEWRMGYTERFGIVAVDFEDPQRTRRIKDSGHWLSQYFFKLGRA